MTLLIHLMGSVRVTRDGQLLDIGGPKQRTVLAVLALSAGHRVSTERLIDLVWDERPPASARRTVQSYVASLRGALDDGAPLTPSPSGYTLDVDRCAVDVLAFEDRAAHLLTGAVHDPDERANALADVLSTWDTPLDDLRVGSRLEDLAAPFDELRFQVVEALASAQIAGSRPGDAVRMLEALVRERPTRENLWHELALGLHRLGRRDAALNAIQRAREALREHLGVHPSALLAALEARLLVDDGSITDDAGSGSRRDPTAMQPAPRSGNLPKSLSSFIGRADEIGEIVQFLTEARLVTLRGLGGIGKTSLALRVAADCVTEFDDGVWFVDLAYVAPSAAMSERFLAALGLRPRAEVAPMDQLLAHLAPLRALLVVDNCEGHVAEIAELIAQIVHRAHDVSVLATSRTRLAVAGEAVWQVGPLDESTAVELFAARARLIRRHFELSDANRQVVQSICGKLDGIPLAIELAAARLDVLGLDQILEHLDDRFGLLGGQTSAGRDDERTLRAALEWSAALLDDDAHNLLGRLTIFPAEFTLDAANDICAAGAHMVDLVSSMGSLVAASLVVFEADDAEPRYRLLETVREYASEMLSATDRREIALGHARYYVDVAAQIAIRHETDHAGALQAGDREIDNLRAAIATAFGHGDHDLGLAALRHLRMYFFSRQLNREFLRWLESGLTDADPTSDETLHAIASALVAAINADEVDVADRLAERVKHAIDLAPTPVLRAALLSSYGAYLSDLDPRAADELLAAATALVKPIGTLGAVTCIHNRLYIGWLTGDLPSAAEMLADLDDLPDGPLVRRERALVEIQAAACDERWQEVIDSSFRHALLDEETSSDMLCFRAEALGALGRIDDAFSALDDVDELLGGEDLARSGPQRIRATTELRRGNPAVAASLLAASAVAYRESERAYRLEIASLGGTALHQLGDDDNAALLFGYARAVRDEFDIDIRMSQRPLVEHASQQCRAALTSDRFDELLDRGARADWAELVERLRRRSPAPVGR